MKLSKIYSNQKNFKEVIFNEKLNFVVGKIKNEYGKNDTHNLGKTKLADLIDFMLLVDGTKKIREGKKIFLLEYQKNFIEHIFYLELEIKKGSYLTIKRSVKNKNKISFKLHERKNQNFDKEVNWDYKDVPLGAKKSKNAKEVLSEILNFDIIKEKSIRKYLGYFIRTQYDYTNTFKLKNKNDSWKPLLLELLGFNSKDLSLKYKLKKEIDDQKKFMSRESKSYEFEDLDILKQLILSKIEEKNNFENKIDNFDFYTEENDINQKIINELEVRISKLNTEKYYKNQEIKKITLKLQYKAMHLFDIKQTEKLFKEVNLNFPEKLKKSYEDLINFNTEITKDRKINLENLLEEKSIILDEIIQELIELNNKRMSYLNNLTEKETFKKFKNFQQEIIFKEKEILELEVQIKELGKEKELEEELDSLNQKMKETNQKIQELTEEASKNNFYKNFQLTYQNLIYKIINLSATIDIETNKNKNIEFKNKVKNEENQDIAKGEGYTYGRILTACFDLSLLITHQKNSFIKFIYHDGIFEGLDPRDKDKFYEAIKNICEEYGIQYITTALETDLTSKILKNEEYSKEVVLTLTDEEDGKGTLMGFEF